MSTEPKPSRSLGRRITTKVILAVLLFAATRVFVLYGGHHGRQLAALFEKNPPIAITGRSGILSDYVIAVQNLSSQRMVGHFHISNPSGESMTMRFSIAPNGEKEMGRLELNDWPPSKGDSGWIEFDGWARVLKFTLSSEGYTYDFGLPPVD